MYQGPVLLASSQGGMNIEDVARDTPEALVTEPVDIETGMTDEIAMRVVTKIGFEGKQALQVTILLTVLFVY